MVRLLSGVTLAAAVFALIWFGTVTVLVAVAILVALLALHEYIELMRQIGVRVPWLPTMVVTAACVAVVPYRYPPIEILLTIGLIVIAVSVMLGSRAAAAAGDQMTKPIADAARSATAAVLAPIYLGLTLGTVVAIHVTGGRGAVFLMIATIIVSDTAQYYSGRTFGKHYMAPVLSPKKTVEGAAGGLVLAPVFLVLAAPYFLSAAPSRALLALTGLALVVCGIAGDLFESMLKRAAGVKDSAALIPGHGGILDRIDAILFAAPVFYLFMRAVSPS